MRNKILIDLSKFMPTFSASPSPHVCLPECFLSKLLQKGTNGQSILVKKRNFRMGLEDELRKMVTPELVSYSMCILFFLLINDKVLLLLLKEIISKL